MARNKSIQANAIVHKTSHVVRADRFNNFLKAYGLVLKVDGCDCVLSNISESGVAFYCNEFEFERNQTVSLRIVTSQQNNLYEGMGRVAWRKLDESGTLYGLEFRSGYLGRDFLYSLDILDYVRSEITKEQIQFEGIPENFKSLVFEIRNFLKLLKSQLDDIEEKMELQSAETKESFLKATEIGFGDYVTEKLQGYGKRLFSHLDLLKDKAKRNYYLKFFREELNDFYMTSPYAKRALLKPRGYAGDYEMMNQVYRNSYEGRSLFGKIIHKYTVNEHAAKSVRERKQYLAKKIAEVVTKKGPESDVNILSLASGPAQEIVEFIRHSNIQCSNKIIVHLIDQDVEALLNARRNIAEELIESDLNLEVVCYPTNIKDIIEGHTPSANQNDGFDLIYSAGLYDYLLQPLAKAITQTLSQNLNVGGQIIIGNFHPNSPTRAICEFAADWKLVYRDEGEMLDLIAGIPTLMGSTCFDNQEIVVYLECIKRGE